MTYDVVIVGGGLAGLTSAILLARKQYSVCLFEKKHYPFHRVCGEYVSNEVLPFLKAHDLYPDTVQPSSISRFLLSDIQGRTLHLPLDLGGFGISRYAFDHFLVQKARDAGVMVYEGASVTDIAYKAPEFTVQSSRQEDVRAAVVIGAYGKQARLDKQLDRGFSEKDNDFIGVKYHIRGDFDQTEIALHNFPGGYCGMSAVEGETFNLCYLGRRSDLRTYGTAEGMQRELLCQNPYLRKVFNEADFVFDKPIVISNFGFYPRTAVENHILMAGDAAGLITPLCGNGMAMAIHGAKLASEAITECLSPGERLKDRESLEKRYADSWNKSFKTRLRVGRRVQQLFGHAMVSALAVRVASTFRPLATSLMKRTHGEPFQ